MIQTKPLPFVFFFLLTALLLFALEPKSILKIERKTKKAKSTLHFHVLSTFTARYLSLFPFSDAEITPTSIGSLIAIAETFLALFRRILVTHSAISELVLRRACL